MYKKITHNIVEEHFAHPLAADLKKKIEKSKLEEASVPTQSQLDTHRAVTTFFWGVRNFLINALSAHDDAATASKNSLLTGISDFIPVFRSYPAAVGTGVVTHLTGLVNAYADAIAAAKAGKDIAPFTSAMQTHCDSLVQVLSSANPNHWPATVAKSYLYTYASLLADQLNARVKKDWPDDIRSENHAMNLMISGPVTYTSPLKNWVDFATFLMSGLPKQSAAITTPPGNQPVITHHAVSSHV